MSKGKKIALGLLIILILFVVGLAIIVPMLFDVDRYRPQVAAQIQQETGKPVEIGHLALTILPEVAIRADNFTLGNPAGFPTGDFVKAKKIYAVVDPIALLHHKVNVTSLELSDISVNMLENSRGKWNYENPPAKPDPPSDPPAENSGSFTMGIISRLTVTRGEFSVANLLASGVPGPALMQVHSASIDLHQVDLNAFTTASLRSTMPDPHSMSAVAGWFETIAYAAESHGAPVAAGTMKADKLEFDPLVVTKVKSKLRLFSKEAYFDDLDLKCYGGSATGNLSLNFGGSNLAYAVDTKIKGVNMAEFLAAFPQAKGMMTGTLNGTAQVDGLVTHSADPLYGVKGSGQASVLNGQMPSLKLGSNLRALAKIANVGPASGDPSSFSSLSADFHIADSRLTSNKIDLVGNGVDVNGSGNMTMAGEGSLDYTGEASLAASNSTNPLANVLGGLTGAKIENGKMIFPFTVAGTFAKPKFGLKGGAGQSPTSPAGVQQDVNLVRGISGLFKKKKQ